MYGRIRPRWPGEDCRCCKLTAKSVRSLATKPIHTLIVPGAFAVDEVTRDRALVQWVKKRACRRVCSVCIGSFLLAAAGILNARRTATYWMHARCWLVDTPA